MPSLVADDCSALTFFFVVCLFVFPIDRKLGRQIRLTAITGEQRRGGFSEPCAVFAVGLFLSFTQLVKIFYCTCASHLPVRPNQTRRWKTTCAFTLVQPRKQQIVTL